MAEGHQSIVAVDDLSTFTGTDAHGLGSVKLVTLTMRQQQLFHDCQDLRAGGKVCSVGL